MSKWRQVDLVSKSFCQNFFQVNLVFVLSWIIPRITNHFWIHYLRNPSLNCPKLKDKIDLDLNRLGRRFFVRLSILLHLIFVEKCNNCEQIEQPITYYFTSYFSEQMLISKKLLF